MNIYVLHISFNVILTDDGTNYLVTHDGANLSPKSLQYLFSQKNSSWQFRQIPSTELACTIIT